VEYTHSVPDFSVDITDLTRTAPTKAANGVRTNGRAFNSSNWRVKSDDSPNTNTPRFNNQSGNNSPRSPFNKSWQPVPQSITEGRRLYVGNMPYTAKREDVETIFEGGEYSMCDLSMK
jgi:RNA recognition motif-containing protein